MSMDMHDYGFYRLAAAVPPCTVGNCTENAEQILRLLKESAEMGADVAVFPALALTSAGCGDLFAQRSLLNAAEDRMVYLVRQSASLPVTGIVGFPFFLSGRIYSAAAVFTRGTFYGIVPLNGSVQSRIFSQYDGTETAVISDRLQSGAIPFGADLLFEIEASSFSFMIGSGDEAGGCESNGGLGEAAGWRRISGSAARAGVSLRIEPLAQGSYAGSFTELCRNAAVRSKQDKNACMFVNAGWGESTTDTACAGERGIYENGELLAAASGFELSAFNKRTYTAAKGVCAATENARSDGRNGDTHGEEGFRFTGYVNETSVTIADIDCEAPHLVGRIPSAYRRVALPAIPARGVLLIRPRNPVPFIPLAVQNNEAAWEAFFSQVTELQARGLAKRMHHTGCNKTIVGVSGGLDSTLALLIALLAARILNQRADSVTAVTMPGFGTTNRTKSNAIKLAELLGCTVLTVPIEKALLQHFADIEHPAGVYNTVYENAQARERTQILMDKANQIGALLVGTGDLSESALGWETYNGDHMSMYNVNAGVPKTLLRHCIRYFAAYPAVFLSGFDSYADFRRIIRDILDTPISPELLLAAEQTIVQRTEDILGPYELHDFFLYYLLHTDFSPAKILLLAEHCFSADTKQQYSRQQILSCMRLFYRRFFSQQFKRSCAPDGIQVGFGSFSPRGGWQMPSDSSAAIWLAELEKLSEI